MTAPGTAWEQLAAAFEYPAGAPADLQERYVAAFDLDPACSLNIGWHLFGERHERGEFLAALSEELHRAGIDDRGELPDYLPFVLRLMPHLDRTRATQLGTAVTTALDRIRDGVQRHDERFVALVDGARRLVNGQTSEAGGHRSGTTADGDPAAG